MSIIVKGMEMPKNCAECRLWDTCEYLNDFDDWIGIFEAVEDGDLVRDKNCPLSEVPTPHGHLIDADKLMMSLADWWYAIFGQEETDEAKAIRAVMRQVEKSIDEMTVIEAEGRNRWKVSVHSE